MHALVSGVQHAVAVSDGCLLGCGRTRELWFQQYCWAMEMRRGMETMDVSFIRYVVKAVARYAVLFSPLQRIHAHTYALRPNRQNWKYIHSFQNLKHIFLLRTKEQTPNTVTHTQTHTHTSCVKCIAQKDDSRTPHIDSSNGASSPLTGHLNHQSGYTGWSRVQRQPHTNTWWT